MPINALHSKLSSMSGKHVQGAPDNGWQAAWLCDDTLCSLTQNRHQLQVEGYLEPGQLEYRATAVP